jgi:hypothetical protein
MQYTQVQLEYIHALKQQGYKWPEIEDLFNKKFKLDKSHDALRFAYARHLELHNAGLEEVDVALLRQARNASKSSSKNRKALDLALESIDQHQSILESMKELIKGGKFPKIEVPKKKVKSITHSTPMVMEVLLSDLHYGKKTDTFDSVRARKMMSEYAKEVLLQLNNRTLEGYAIQRLDICLLGDIIESSTMHGAESLKGCEFGNSEQVVLAIKSLFEDFFVPVLSQGVPMVVNCVAGNHERVEMSKTYNKPGKEYLSWVIYNSLDMLCEKVFPKSNIKFNIAEGPVLLHKIFNDYVVYEHFDLTGACTKKALAEMMNKRQTQLGKVVQYYRGGHYHEYTIFDRGRIIVNGCLPGPDGYSESLGFNTEPVQAINFYAEDKDKPNTYLYSYPVYLGHV